jgi:DinB family protein
MHTCAERQDMITVIRRLPADLEVAVKELNEQQLDMPYREGGWTVRQVIHHLADAHMNGFIRIKLMLTEDRPTLKPYDQETWARTVDATQMPIANSLAILQGLHNRLSALLESLPETNFHRSAVHPEIGEVTLGNWVATLARHGKNHLAQINGLRAVRGW